MTKQFLTCLMLVPLLSACASTVLMPTEIAPKDPLHRVIDDKAGRTPQETATKCAHNMAEASPSRAGAKEIQYRIIGVDNPLIVEVDAVLLDVGTFGRSLPVTYRCEYSNGLMTLSKWTRGLK